MQLPGLEGKVALVTGGGSGIGEAAARLLASCGAKVGVLSRDDNEVLSVSRSIQDAGGQALPLVADISKPGELQQAIAQLVEHWGRLEIVFANAGINGVWAPIEELSPEEWEKTLRTNLDGTFFTVKYSVPHLKQQGGSVIITSSVNGTRIFSNAGAAAYSSSKAGQVAFAKMAALELAKHHIRVNVICPGWVSTNIEENTQKRDVDAAREPVEYPAGTVPLTDGQPGKPEEVANLVAFLASDASKHISGTEIWIDGAESLLIG